ncbi:unnamed protein product [Cunninghamella echinulata]
MGISFGACISNIVTGICMFYRIIGGSTPILYTIDWYLASYLIIKQLKYGRNTNDDDDDDDEDIEYDEEDMRITQFSHQEMTSSINNNNDDQVLYTNEKAIYSPTMTSPTINSTSYPNDHFYKQKL